jgi:predicted RNase H-like nuclease (RuvC/YqgF family)
VHGQRWTDGLLTYSDDGSWAHDGHETTEDLVEYIGPLPGSSQRAPVSRPAETESTTAVEGSVSEDPGRIIHNLEQRLEAAKNRNRHAQEQLAQRHQTINDQTAEIDRLRTELQQTQAWRTAATDAHSQSEALRIEQATEIERLKAEWQSEFTAAQQLRSQVEQLELLLDDARENLRSLEADGTAMDHHCEGMKAAFLAVIKTFVEMRS